MEKDTTCSTTLAGRLLEELQTKRRIHGHTSYSRPFGFRPELEYLREQEDTEDLVSNEAELRRAVRYRDVAEWRKEMRERSEEGTQVVETKSF